MYNARKFEVPRAWQDGFCEHLHVMGFDCYGEARAWDYNRKFAPELSAHLDEYYREFGRTDTHYLYENDVFTIMPYYWGDDDMIQALPNFVYKPTGFTLEWYKYALRSAYMSHDVTYAELTDMLRHCADSLRKETA